jgi:uncharacterized sodium:solute symporter family permease YidK
MAGTTEGEEMSDNEAGTEAVKSASSALFDLRTVIAILFLVYGVVLTVMGFVSDTPEELAKAGGIDINLWSGIVMIVIGALFVAWALWRPLKPPVVDPTEG